MSEGEMTSRLSEIVPKADAVKTSKKWKELTKNLDGNKPKAKKKNDDDANKTIVYDSYDDNDANKTIIYEPDDDANKTIIYEPDEGVKKSKVKEVDPGKTIAYDEDDIYAKKTIMYDPDNIYEKKTIIYDPDDNFKGRGDESLNEERKKIFKGFHMVVLIQGNDKETERVKSVITSIGGVVEEELSGDNKVTHIVVDTYEWDILFDDCLEVAGNVVFVHYEWVLKCVSVNSLVKIDPYTIKKPT